MAKKNLKKFQKTLDKPQKVWYNIRVVRVEKLTLKTKYFIKGV
jgi:hypothetical protein